MFEGSSATSDRQHVIRGRRRCKRGAGGLVALRVVGCAAELSVVGCAADGCPLARVYRCYVRRSMASLPGAFSQNSPPDVRRSVASLPGAFAQSSITPRFDESRLCKKIHTVIAVILHPSRDLFVSVRKSYDRFSVQASPNPQTKTTLWALCSKV